MASSTSKTFEKYMTDEKFRDTVDYLFNRAEPYVQKFAESYSLTLDKWFHDLPLWILSWQDGDISRLIHVGPAQEDGDSLSLAVAVDAYRDIPSEEVRYELSHGIVIGRISANKITKEPGSIDGLLSRAYSTAKDVSDKDLKESLHLTRI